MQSPSLFTQSKTNMYAILSLVNGGLAFVSNGISLLVTIIPGVSFVCGAVSGLLSLGALITAMVGLGQIKREQNIQKGKRLAVAGIVLGVLGLIGACLIPLFGTALLSTFGLQILNQIIVPIE